MATALAGHGGSVQISSTAVGGIKDWTITINQGTGETTAFGDSAKKFIATVRDATVSFDGFFDHSDTEQAAIQTALLGATTITPSFFVDGTHYYSGTVIVTKWTVKAAVDGLVEVTIDGQVSGDLSYT